MNKIIQLEGRRFTDTDFSVRAQPGQYVVDDNLMFFKFFWIS